MVVFMEFERCRHNGEVSIFNVRPVSYPNFPFHLADKIGGFVILDELWLMEWNIIINYPMDIPVLYVPVEDYGAPTVEDMDLIIKFIEYHTSRDKEVVVSCIGGHGRTGTVLSVWAGLNGIENPIEYIRKHYCKCAVESKEQEEFVEEYLKLINKR